MKHLISLAAIAYAFAAQATTPTTEAHQKADEHKNVAEKVVDKAVEVVKKAAPAGHKGHKKKGPRCLYRQATENAADLLNQGKAPGEIPAHPAAHHGKKKAAAHAAVKPADHAADKAMPEQPVVIAENKESKPA